MNFGKAFSFVFDDPEWLKKVAINALIGLIPIIGALYLLGWGLEVARRVATRHTTPLPDVDFGAHLGHGLKAFVVALVYTVPMWVITIPMVVISLLIEGSRMGSDAAATLYLITNVCGGLLIFLYGLFMGFVLPAALTRAVVNGSIKAGIQFKPVLAIVGKAPAAYLLTMVGVIVVALLAGMVGSLACGIGLIFTAAYQQAVTGHFYGQAYLQGSAGV